MPTADLDARAGAFAVVAAGLVTRLSLPAFELRRRHETVLPTALFAALEERQADAGAPARRAAPARPPLLVRDELVKAGATLTVSPEEVRRRLAAAAEEER